jgi:hypothetical protein
MDILYIDDTIVDLKPDTRIAWTIQRLEIGDITKSSVSYSNIIKALPTESNNRLFQNANNIHSAGRFQFQVKTFKLVQNGVETVTNGRAYITEFDEGYYSITLYDGFVSLISFIDGKDLTTLDLGAQAWNAADIDSARLNTSAWISAVVNFGRSTVYDSNYFLPAYFYKTLIEKIFQLTGYTVSGAILTDTDYTDLVCFPVKNFKYPESLTQNSAKISRSGTGGTFLDDVTNAVAIDTDVVDYGVSNTESTEISGTPLIAVKALENYTADMTVTFNVSAVSYTGVCFFNLRICRNNLTTVIGASGNITTTGVVTLTVTDVAVNQGDFIFASLFLAGATAGEDGTISFTAMSLTITANQTVNRALPFWGKLVTNASLKDVLKDFFMRFGIVYKLQDNVIILQTLQSIITDTANALDWTSKRVIEKDTISFKTNYGQRNYFLYNDSVNDKFLGSGLFEIDNENLPDVKETYKSVFANTNKWDDPNYNIARIPVYDSTSTGIGDVKEDSPLVLATLKNRIGEPGITFNAISRTDYKMAYFLDSTRSKDTSFQYFLNKYYPLFFEALNQGKTVTYRYMLTELDVASYDPHRMVYDDGSYYLINKIKNFVPDTPTEVELLKIN